MENHTEVDVNKLAKMEIICKLFKPYFRVNKDSLVCHVVVRVGDYLSRAENVNSDLAKFECLKSIFGKIKKTMELPSPIEGLTGHDIVVKLAREGVLKGYEESMRYIGEKEYSVLVKSTATTNVKVIGTDKFSILELTSNNILVELTEIIDTFISDN